MRKTLITLFLFLTVFSLPIQGAIEGKGKKHSVSKKHKKKKKSKKKFAKRPYWKEMMADPEVNYFEAKEAFDAYWKGEDPEEVAEHSSPENLKGKSKKEIKEEHERLALAAEFKIFRKWLIDSAPFVQPDGTVLSEEEQLQIIKSAR